MSILFWLRRQPEISITIGVIGSLLLLPVLTISVVASAAIAPLSSALAQKNVSTQTIEIFNPTKTQRTILSVQSVWPVSGTVTSEFGSFESERRLLGLSRHTGLDIAAPIGTPVTPLYGGTVEAVSTRDTSACGIEIRIRHSPDVTTRYCHLSSVAAVIGQTVITSSVIGRVGSTGASTGPHLHLEVRVYDIAVNPRTFLGPQP